MGLILGIDAGTTALKVGVFSERGAALGSAREEYSLASPQPDRAELDPERYWQAAAAATQRALAAAAVSGADVGVIGVSSQGETVIALGPDDRALGPAIVWLDNRAAAEASEIAERFDRDEVYATTGVPEVNPTWTATKIAWWRRHDPELFRAAAAFLLVEDFVLHRLTGRLVTEGGVQCTSLLYDIRRQAWWPAMLEHVGLTADRLPAIARPGAVVGTLTAEAADALGLRRGIPVVAAGMDQGAGAVAVGNTSPGIVSESTGGALVVQASVDRPDGDPTRQTPVYVHSAPDRYLYAPVCPTGGMALTWFRDRFGDAEVREATAEGRDAYDLLTAAAAAIPPGAEGLTMLPHLAGAFSPEYEPRARCVFFGFGLTHTKAHFVRATLEAVAFMLRRNLELLDGIGVPAREIRSQGGGARSPLWCQIKADVCARPVLTMAGEDAAVRGAAMLAGVAAGVFATLAEATSAMVIAGRTFEPAPAAVAAYEPAYRRYVELFETLRPVFRTLGARTA